jgi:hypothetical protein
MDGVLFGFVKAPADFCGLLQIAGNLKPPQPKNLELEQFPVSIVLAQSLSYISFNIQRSMICILKYNLRVWQLNDQAIKVERSPSYADTFSGLTQSRECHTERNGV